MDAVAGRADLDRSLAAALSDVTFGFVLADHSELAAGHGLLSLLPCLHGNSIRRTVRIVPNDRLHRRRARTHGTARVVLAAGRCVSPPAVTARSRVGSAR